MFTFSNFVTNKTHCHFPLNCDYSNNRCNCESFNIINNMQCHSEKISQDIKKKEGDSFDEGNKN